jgi:cyclopropane fatty-acyl-phospholipid synthase-like methyltransferase
MNAGIERHYGGGKLADTIAAKLEAAGKSLSELRTTDLAAVDEFHIGARRATLELGTRMELQSSSSVLDLGCGLGGPARTLAETYGCNVTGIDLTEEFCEAGNIISEWVHLEDKVKLLWGMRRTSRFRTTISMQR